METNVNENEKVEPSSLEKAKTHWAKHKKKYITCGLIALAFGFGYHFGNRGNSKRHYTKLLKDGVSDAVREGMRDVTREGMRDVVKSGMRDVVEDVITDVVDDVVVEDIVGTIRKTVSGTVKSAIKESAVTIIKEVKEVKEEQSSIKPKHIEELQKILNNLTEDRTGLEIRYDSEGNVYIVKKDA